MDVEQRARELLASALMEKGEHLDAAHALSGDMDGTPAHRAIIAALTPPDGYALVPVVPTEAMITAFWGKVEHGDHERAAAEDAWRDALAARPEVPDGRG